MLARLRGLPWRSLLPWILFALALLAAATFAFLWQQAVAEERERDEVRAAARDFVLALTNFSAQTIEEDTQRIRSFAVGDFEREAEAFFGAEAIAAIRESEAASSGQIDELFVQGMSEDEASVFAVVSETVTNRALEEPRTDTLRLEVGMIRTRNGWRVNSVDVFQAPGTTTTLPGLPQN